MKLAPRLPTRMGLIFRGHPQIMLQCICECLIEQKFEW